MSASKKELIEAIRSDRLIGRGSCSSIDECFDDEELWELLSQGECTTVREAIRLARESEALLRNTWRSLSKT